MASVPEGRQGRMITDSFLENNLLLINSVLQLRIRQIQELKSEIQAPFGDQTSPSGFLARFALFC